MTHQLAMAVSVVGFLICIAAALILALGSKAKKLDSKEPDA
jgi:hypothetical protein